jgi:hypothetical protein
MKNFTSFYGEHVLTLQKGVSFIEGHCGTGRTNLARAFRFAVLGSSDVPRRSLIHFRHMRECKESLTDPFCEAEVEIGHEGKAHNCQSRLSLVGNEVRQTTVVDSDIDDIITSESFKLIYLDPFKLEIEEENRLESLGIRTFNATMKHLEMNLEAGIGIAFLDRITEHLTVKYEEKLLKFIDGLALDQVIILGNRLPYYPEDHVFKVYRIEFDLPNYTSKLMQ